MPYGSHPQTCPVRAFQDWLEASAITTGPLFRPINRHSKMADDRLLAKAVAGIVKRSARRIGLDVDKFASHSLRSATSAALAGVSERAIIAQTGHGSLTIVRKCIRSGSLFRKDTAALLAP